MTLREELNNKFSSNRSEVSIKAVLYDYLRDVVGEREIEVEMERNSEKGLLNCKITEKGPIEFKDNRLSLLSICDFFVVNGTQGYSIDKDSGELDIEGDSDDLEYNKVEFSIVEPNFSSRNYFIYNLLKYAPKVKIISNGIVKSEGEGVYNYKGVNLPREEKVGTLYYSGDIVMGGFVFQPISKFKVAGVLSPEEEAMFSTYMDAGLIVLEKDAIKVDLNTGNLDATDDDIRRLYDLAKKQWELAVKLKRKEFGGKLTGDNLDLILNFDFLDNRGRVAKYDLNNMTWEEMVKLYSLINTVRIQGGNAAYVDQYKGFTKSHIKLIDLIEANSEGKLLGLPSRLSKGEKHWIKTKYTGHYFIKPDIDTLPKIAHDYLIEKNGLLCFAMPKEETDLITKQLNQPDKRMIRLRDNHSSLGDKTLNYYLEKKDIILITREEHSGTVGKYMVCKLKKKDYDDLKRMGFTTLDDYIEENKSDLSLLRIYHIIENLGVGPLINFKFPQEFKDRMYKINSNYSQIGVNSYNFDIVSYFRNVPIDDNYKWMLELRDIFQVFGRSTDPRNLELRKELLRDALEKKLKDKYNRKTDEICCN